MKVRSLLFLCLFSLFLFCLESNSFASTFVESKYKGNGAEIIDYFIDNYFNGGNANIEVNLGDCKNDLNNFSNICIQFNPGSGTYWTHYLNVYLSNNSFVINGSKNQITIVRPTKSYQFSNYRNSLSSTVNIQNSGSGLIISIGSLGSNYNVCYVDNNISNQWWKSSNVNFDIDTLVIPKFTPDYDRKGSYNNFSDININNVSRNINSWFLGRVSNFDDPSVFEISGTFHPLAWVSGDDYLFDLPSGRFNYYRYDGTNNYNLSFDSSGGIYISNSVIYYDQLYLLDLFYSDDGNSSYNIGEYYFYFKPLGDSSAISQLINPDYNTDLDIGWINSFGRFWEDATNISPSDIGYVMGSIGLKDRSGDNFNSGDLFNPELPNKLGYNNSTSDTTYDVMIYRIYKRFVGAFAGDSQLNPSISFSIHGHTYTFYASDFSVPDGPLKAFISTFLIAGIVYLLIFQFHKYFLMITTLDLHRLASSFDRDHSVFM